MIRIRTKLHPNVKPAMKKIFMILEVLHLIAFMVQVTEQSDCGTYRAENGKTCHMCNPGNHKIGDCMEDGMPARCLPCPDGTYQTTCNQALSCALCAQYCPYYHSVNVSECSKTSDIKCQCNPGFHFEGGVDGKCFKHKPCPPSQGVKMQGTPISDTVCEPCIPGKTFSNISTSIQQCQNCSTCIGFVISECTTINNTVCAIGDSHDIEMDVEPIDQSDIDLHQNHVHAAAEHHSQNNAGFPDISFQYTESRDQTQPKEYISASEQTMRIQQGNTAFREEQKVFPKEPGCAISPSRCRMPTAQEVHSILDILSKEIVTNFRPFFRFLVLLSPQRDKEMPNVETWIEQEYENWQTNTKEAHYQLLGKWKGQRGGIDEKFCKNIKKALEQSGENMVLAKLEHMFRECFSS